MSQALDTGLAAGAHLGAGGEGPWENRSHLASAARAAGLLAYPIVSAWLNATYSVQLLRHDTHPGIDHLVVKRHDDGTNIPWPHLQKIKDRLLPNGQLRWAIEVFPPRLAIVDNCNVRHVWVMPPAWVAPVDLREVRT